jgi:predicted O-methyltransferase YrrM
MPVPTTRAWRVDDWLKVLRTGRPANWPGEQGEADWHAAMRTSEFAEAFSAAMDCRGRILGPALAAGIDLRDARRLLDVGGGTGVYAIACVEAAPALQATVLEADPVAAIARRTVAGAGHAGRIVVTSGDMFAIDWPEGHDLHLFANVLHDWDEPDCRRLLARSAARLPAGGRIVVVDMFLDDAKDGPLWAAEYSVLLASVTQGRLYAPAEIAGWAADLGLAVVRRQPLPLGRGLLELARPAAARACPIAGPIAEQARRALPGGTSCSDGHCGCAARDAAAARCFAPGFACTTAARPAAWRSPASPGSISARSTSTTVSR